MELTFPWDILATGAAVAASLALLFAGLRPIVRRIRNTSEDNLWTLAALVALLPIGAVAWRWISPGEEPFDSDDVRNLVTAVAGVFALAIVYATLRRSSAMEKQNEVAQAQAEAALKQAEIAEATRVTEQFTKAVELLSAEKDAGRIGGITVLERLSVEAPELKQPVFAILDSHAQRMVRRASDIAAKLVTRERELARELGKSTSGPTPQPPLPMARWTDDLWDLYRRGLATPGAGEEARLLAKVYDRAGRISPFFRVEAPQLADHYARGFLGLDRS